MTLRTGWRTAALGTVFAALALAASVAQETPKRGGTLTYMIPADGPPSFDGHREATYATVHSAAPYYSVLIRVDPNNPGSATDFVCDLCTEMPQPTDDGKTYTFKIRDGVKFHDGSPLTAYDVAESWRKIVDPPEGVTSARQSFYVMVDKIETPDPRTAVHIAGRGQEGDLQLHRGVVQSRPSPFWHPLSIPNRLRDTDAQGGENHLSDKPSTKPGQLQFGKKVKF